MQEEKLIPDTLPELELRDISLGALPVNEELVGPRPGDDLIRDVRMHGILHPVVVKDNGTAGYHVYDGRRRIKASRYLADEYADGSDPADTPYSYIRATVVKTDAPLSPERLAVVLNNTAKPNVATELESMEAMLSRGYSESDIAEACMMQVQSVRSVLKLQNLIPALRSALNRGEISPTVSYEACRLSRGVQERLAGRLEEQGRLTGRDVHEERTAIKARARQTLPFEQMESMGTAPAPVTEPDTATHAPGVSPNALNVARALAERLEAVASKPRGKTPRWTNSDVDHVRTLLDEIERLDG